MWHVVRSPFWGLSWVGRWKAMQAVVCQICFSHQAGVMMLKFFKVYSSKHWWYQITVWQQLPLWPCFNTVGWTQRYSEKQLVVINQVWSFLGNLIISIHKVTVYAQDILLFMVGLGHLYATSLGGGGGEDHIISCLGSRLVGVHTPQTGNLSAGGWVSLLVPSVSLVLSVPLDMVWVTMVGY